MKGLTSNQFDPVTEGYLEYSRDIKRMSPRTLVDMRCTYKQVTTKMAGIRPGRELWSLSFDDFLTWLNQRRRDGASAASIGKEISHLRSLIDYAWRSGRVKQNVLDGFKIKDIAPIVRTAPKVLTIEEAQRLVSACPPKTPRHRRERLMILLLYGCGFRSGELCRLDVKDIDIDRQEVFVRQAKGDIQRRVPVPLQVWTELLAYLTQRKTRRGPLFVTEVKKTRISQHDVLMAVHSAAARAQLPDGVVPKTLRHSFGTHLMEAGVDLSVIASLMGHRSPNESGVYLHALPGRKESAVRRVDISQSLDSELVKVKKEESQ